MPPDPDGRRPEEVCQKRAVNNGVDPTFSIGRKSVPGLIRKAPRIFELHLAVPPHRPRDMLIGFLHPEVSLEALRDVMLCIPNRRHLKILNLRIINSRMPCFENGGRLSGQILI
jgi:hypothetical protein